MNDEERFKDPDEYEIDRQLASVTAERDTLKAEVARLRAEAMVLRRSLDGTLKKLDAFRGGYGRDVLRAEKGVEG